MKASIFTLFLIILIFSEPGDLWSQEDSTYITRISLTDGSELVGTILEENDEAIVFKTTSGLEMNLDRGLITEIKLIKGEWSGGEFLRLDPNRTRLFFAPTGRTISGGGGYFSVYEIFFPFIAINIADFIVLSGGMSLFPGADEQMIYFAPKVRALSLEQFDLSAGVLYAHIRKSTFGILYGVGTYGSASFSATMGLGWGYDDEDLADSPILLLGAEAQISNSFKFITENWILPGDNPTVFSFGIRFFGESLAADFALVGTTESTDGFPFIPWIGFAYNF